MLIKRTGLAVVVKGKIPSLVALASVVAICATCFALIGRLLCLWTRTGVLAWFPIGVNDTRRRHLAVVKVHDVQCIACIDALESVSLYYRHGVLLVHHKFIVGVQGAFIHEYKAYPKKKLRE